LRDRSGLTRAGFGLLLGSTERRSCRRFRLRRLGDRGKRRQHVDQNRPQATVGFNLLGQLRPDPLESNRAEPASEVGIDLVECALILVEPVGDGCDQVALLLRTLLQRSRVCADVGYVA